MVVELPWLVLTGGDVVPGADVGGSVVPGSEVGSDVGSEVGSGVDVGGGVEVGVSVGSAPQPSIEGTASLPVPMATRSLPQSSVLAMWTLRLSQSKTT